MPCRGPEPWEELYNYRIKNEPEFRESEKVKSEQMRKEWDEEHKLFKKKEEKEFNDELNNKNLENTAFNSFMTVFLCKAMEIVVSNFDYKYVNSDLEWWFKEHKLRDNNYDKSELTSEELSKKLIKLNKKYRVK